MNRIASSVCGAVVAVACGAGGIRPSYPPFPSARSIELTASGDTIIRAAAGEVSKEQGMAVQWISAEEGYLETQWYNPETQRSGSITTGVGGFDQMVRIRFWTAPVGPGRIRVTGEAAVLQTFDPARPLRDQEMPAPTGHFGDRFVGRVLDVLKQRFPR